MCQLVQIKLPTLSFPTFSDTTSEWLTYSDLFEEAVSEESKTFGNTKIALKGCFKGDGTKNSVITSNYR